MSCTICLIKSKIFVFLATVCCSQSNKFKKWCWKFPLSTESIWFTIDYATQLRNKQHLCLTIADLSRQPKNNFFITDVNKKRNRVYKSCPFASFTCVYAKIIYLKNPSRKINQSRFIFTHSILAPLICILISVNNSHVVCISKWCSLVKSMLCVCELINELLARVEMQTTCCVIRWL